MGDDITIGVTEIVNNIEVTAQPNDQIVDISVTDNADNVTLNITPTVIEINVNKGSSFAKWGDIYGTLSDQTDLQNALNLRVPYTGATSNVNLGEYGLTGGFLALDTTPTSTPTGIGTIYWDAANRTAALIDGDGDTTLQIGQEQRILVHNNTGSTLTDGQVVYVTGSTGNLPSVSLANASSETTSAATLGVVTESIAQGADGFITTSGIVNGLNTLAFNEGDLLWLGTTAGTFTATKPISPNHLVLIGYVIKKAGGNGSILVKIQNTQELEESSDVLFTSLTNKDFLVYESATDLWKNKSLGTIVGGTSSQFIKGDGSLDSTVYALDNTVVKITTNQNVRGIKTFLGDQTATTLKLIVADYYNDGFITSDNGMLRLLNGTTELFNLASTGDLTAKSFVKTGGTASQFLKANGTVDSTTYLSGTVAIANGGTGATTASAARTNLGATTIGSGLFTLPNAGLTSFLRVNADNTVELLGADLFRTSIGAGTGNGSVTSVSGTGSYGGLTLTGTVTGSGDLTLGGTPTGTWPISITGNASSVNTVQVSTNADFYLTFADGNNGSPTSEFLYTIGSVKVNPSTGALTAASFIKSGGTSSQFLKADGSVDSSTYALTSQLHDAVTLGATGVLNGLSLSGQVLSLATASSTTRGALTAEDYSYFFGKQNALTNPVTGTGTTNYIPKFTGASAIGNSLIYDNGTNVGIGTTSPSNKLSVFNTLGLPSSSALSEAIILVQDSGSNRRLGIGSSTSGQWIQSAYPGVEGIASNLLLNPSGGNVGIGTTSPSAKLHVVGNVYSSGYFNSNNIYLGKGSDLFTGGSANDGGLMVSGSNNLIFGNALTERMRLTTNGELLIGRTSSYGAGWQLAVEGNIYAKNDLRIDANASFGGNVGIGTASPVAVSGYNALTINGTSGGILYTQVNGTTAGFFSTESSFTVIGESRNVPLWFATNNSIKGGFSAAGNFGIGTTSPSDKLVIYDSTPFVTVIGTSSGGTGVFGYKIKDGSGSSVVDFTYNSATGENKIGGIQSYVFPTFYSGGSERMRITSGGNVGIGNTSPSTKLDVTGAITASGGFFNSDMRLKELTDYDYKVLDIKPITYLWKDGRDNKKHVGYSAQEVQKVMPDAVNEGTDGMLSVNYVEVLVAKIAELENRIKQLEK